MSATLGLLAFLALALHWIELTLAKTERFWRHFEQLVIEQEVDALFKGIFGVGCELDGAVAGVGAHIGELFFLADVDVEVVLFVG